MPLQKFFASQKKQIEMFLADPHRTMMRLAVDPEAEAMVIKLLGAVDGDPRNADVFIGCDHTFDERRSFYQKTLARLAEEFEKVQSKLEKKEIRTSVAHELRGSEDEIESQFAAKLGGFVATSPNTPIIWSLSLAFLSRPDKNPIALRWPSSSTP
jgi:hypothetical protein